MNEADQLCSGPMQDNPDAVADFITEVNVLRANNDQEAMSMDNAMLYLRAANFNSSKAVDIYKNYQKHREAYNLDNLRPYREPLSSEIGSKKLEVVGSFDGEGSPLILFRLCKHDRNSDHKATMQLLFYTLDQVAELEEAQENGIVILVDGRDCSRTSINLRLIQSILTVPRTGYPLYLKAMYLISIPMWMKTQVTINGLFNQDGRIKCINFADLSQYFTEDVLPSSLGGTFIARGDSRPIKAGMTESVKKKHMVQNSRPRLPSTGRQPPGAVNNLVGMFENKGSPVPEQTSPPSGLPLTKTHTKSDKPHPSSPSHHKPLPLKPQLPTRVPPPGHIKPMPPPALHRAMNGHGPQKQASSEPHSSPNQTTRAAPMLPVFAKLKQKTDGPLKPGPSRNVGTTTNTTAANSSATSMSGSKNPPRITPSGIKATRIQEKLEKHLSAGGSSSQAPEGEDRQSVLRTAQEFSTSSSPNTADKRPVELAKHSFASQGKPPVARGKRPLVPVRVLPMDKDREKENEQERERERERVERERERERKREREREREREKSRAKKLPPLPEPRVEKKLPPLPEPRVEKKLPLLPESQKLKHLYTGTPSPSTEETLLYENVSFPPSQATSTHPPSGNPSQSSSRENTTPARPTTASTKPGTKQEAASIRHDYVNVEVMSEPVAGGDYANLEVMSEPVAGGEYANVEIMSEPVASGEYANVEIMSEPVTGYANIDIVNGSDSDEEGDLLFANEAPGPAEEVIYENFGPDEGNRFMTLEELERHISSKGKKGLQIEYLKVKNEPLRTCYTACKLPYNIGKNRYKDVVCYDDTRVLLKALPGVEGSDYIHANYVSGYNKPEAFILTQGPTKKSVADFWRMVWEKQVSVVVMITKCVELGKHKCVQYWPDNGSTTYGSVVVRVAKTQKCEGYDLRTIRLHSEGVERTVMQFHFLAWPDYGVPDSGSAVLSLLHDVQEMQNNSKRQLKDISKVPSHGPPIVVHCSAGVGRSGAFCALDYCIDELKDQRRVNLQGAVRRLRHQRAYAIQTDEQYEFCYRAVLEYGKSIKSHKRFR